MSGTESIIVTFGRSFWCSPDGNYKISEAGWERLDAQSGEKVAEQIVIAGRSRDGDLVSGIDYELQGEWRDDPRRGRSFQFKKYQQQQPHSKAGVIAYLRKYAPGVGPRVASDLYDAFGTDAVKVLRTQPGLAATTSRYLTERVANLAAVNLQEIAALEDTRIELTNLFAGRGFYHSMVDECIRKWGILAVKRISRDPFCLLVAEFAGAGFARCDKLYESLGLPRGRIKRQMICLWHVLRERNSDTWVNVREAIDEMVRLVGGSVPDEPLRGGRGRKLTATERAVKLGVRAKWLALHRDEYGRLWVAEREKAEAEACLAVGLGMLLGWSCDGQEAANSTESDTVA